MRGSKAAALIGVLRRALPGLLSDEEITRLQLEIEHPARRGRPRGSQKFNETDHMILDLAEVYVHDYPSTKEAIHDIVTRSWNEMQKEVRQHVLGKTPGAATARIFARLRPDKMEKDFAKELGRQPENWQAASRYPRLIWNIKPRPGRPRKLF